MCNPNIRLTRRGFLRLSAGAAGGMLLAGCAGQPLQLTAVPAPTPTPATPTPGGPADSICFNGRVVTMDAADTVTQAVALKDGLVLQTGADTAIRALGGPATQWIDLRGRTLTPGLVDNHNHLSAMGLIGTAFVDINPPGVRTIADLQAKIASAVAVKPKGEWVIAQGFVSFAGRFPDRHDLDPVSPDHPVMLINQGGHMGAVNSNALALAGVTASTPDPRFGVFVRDSRGEPTGTLVNHSAMDCVRRLWVGEVMTPDVWSAATVAPQTRFAAVGVTTFADVNSRGLDKTRAYFEAARSHRMTLRAYIMNTIEYYQELAGRPEAIEAMRYEDAYLRFGGFKFLVDGATVAAHTHEPHNGIAWDIATWDPNRLKEAVTTLHAAGYQCAFHVMGDAAVDMALDAIEAAMRSSPRADPRHRLEHALLNTDRALQRTRDLGVCVSTQPQGIRLLGDLLCDLWGETRAQRIIPTRTWLDMGVPLSLSSDAPTMPWYQPQVTLAGSINRMTATYRVIGPEQRLTVQEALRAHTIGGAYAIFEDKTRGSLEPGKLADLIVWRHDPYTAPPQFFADLTVDLTMIGGRIVHQVSP